MQLAWLQRLLADRGIDARFITELRLTCGRDQQVWLEVDCHKVDDTGRRFLVHRAEGGTEVAHEHHVVPVAGLIFEPVLETTAVG